MHISEANSASNCTHAQIVQDWEAECYDEEAERDSEAFMLWAIEQIGQGRWKKLGDRLFDRTSPTSLVQQVFGAEATFIALMVQAWASRVQTSGHLATKEGMNNVDQCVYVSTHALRYVAPDAARKAMRDDA